MVPTSSPMASCSTGFARKSSCASISDTGGKLTRSVLASQDHLVRFGGTPRDVCKTDSFPVLQRCGHDWLHQRQLPRLRSQRFASQHLRLAQSVLHPHFRPRYVRVSPSHPITVALTPLPLLNRLAHNLVRSPSLNPLNRPPRSSNPLTHDRKRSLRSLRSSASCWSDHYGNHQHCQGQ